MTEPSSATGGNIAILTSLLLAVMRLAGVPPRAAAVSASAAAPILTAGWPPPSRLHEGLTAPGVAQREKVIISAQASTGVVDE